jgi:hypothetical protein
VNQIKDFNRTIVVRQRNRSPAGDKPEKIGVLNFELALIRKIERERPKGGLLLCRPNLFKGHKP